MTPIEDILTFWFGEPGSADTGYQQRRKFWFGKSPKVDAEIRSRFLECYKQAAAGQLTEWQATPQGALALVLLLDQFARNMFRDTPQMFATDDQALEIAKEAIARQFDAHLSPVQRLFLYLPLEHSENATDQERSVELIRQLAQANPELHDAFDYALRHQRVIEQFGRFPHRNRILGRPTIPAEAEFLKQPGSSF